MTAVELETIIVGLLPQVITDHEMPRLSGLELVQIVKARPPSCR